MSISRPISGNCLVRIMWSGVAGPLVAISARSLRFANSAADLLEVRLKSIGRRAASVNCFLNEAWLIAEVPVRSGPDLVAEELEKKI